MIMVDNEGRRRQATEKICVHCDKIFLVPLRFQDQKFCSILCRSLSKRVRVVVRCAYCKNNKETTQARLKNSRSGLYFCGRACKDLAQRIENGVVAIHPSHYNNGETNYRERAFRYYGKCCYQCGYAQHEQMLDVDHVDGNRKNNNIENLQVLCVWCHALKTRKIVYHRRQGDVVHLGEHFSGREEVAGS